MKKMCKKSIILTLVALFVLGATGSIFTTAIADEPPINFVNTVNDVWENGFLTVYTNIPATISFANQQGIGTSWTFIAPEISGGNKYYTLSAVSLTDSTNTVSKNINVWCKTLTILSATPTSVDEFEAVTVQVSSNHEGGTSSTLTFGDSTGSTGPWGSGSVTAPDITPEIPGDTIPVTLTASKPHHDPASVIIQVTDTSTQAVNFNVCVNYNHCPIDASVTVSGAYATPSSGTTGGSAFTCQVFPSAQGTEVSASASFINDTGETLSGTKSTKVYPNSVGAGVTIELSDDEEESSQDSSATALCFLAGTKVLMDDLSVKNIEDIRVAESVKSLNMISGDIESDRVIEVQAHSPEEMIEGYLEILFDSGAYIEVTPNHPIMVLETDYSEQLDDSNFDILNDESAFAFLTAGDLKIGDKVLDATVISIVKHLDAKESSYNLILEKNLNYILVFDSALMINADDQAGSIGEIGGMEVSEPLIGWAIIKQMAIANFLEYVPFMSSGLKGNALMMSFQASAPINNEPLNSAPLNSAPLLGKTTI